MSEIASINIGVRLDLSGFKRELADIGRIRIDPVSIGIQLDTSQLMSGFSDAQQRAGRSGEEVGREFGRGLKSQSNFIDGIVQGIGQTIAVGLVSAARAGIDAIGGLGAKILEAGAASERSQATFTAFLGSAEKAKTVLADLTQFAKSTPFELPEVKLAAQSLLAFGLSAEQLKPTLTSVGTVAAAVGIPLNELSQIYGKVRVQGRLYMEDINQLQGRGIPVIQEFAKQMGISTEEVKKLIESGSIGFPDLEKAFQGLTSEGGKFYGLMGELAKTSEQQFRNLIDSFTVYWESAFATIQPVINAVLSSVSTFLSEIQISFGGVNDAAKEFSEFIKDNNVQVVALAHSINAGVSGAIDNVNKGAKQFTDFLSKHPAMVEVVTDAVKALDIVFKTLGDRMKEGLTNLERMAGVFVNMLDTLSKIYVKMKDIVLQFAAMSQTPEWMQKLGVPDVGAQVLGAGMAGTGVQFPVAGAQANQNLPGAWGMIGAGRKGHKHDGIDYQFKQGTAVNSPISGKVVSVLTDKGEFLVTIEGTDSSGRKISTQLVHLASTTVKQGQAIASGQPLGTVGGDRGSWGSNGAHLHITTKINGQVVDPRTFFATTKQIDSSPTATKALSGNKFERSRQVLDNIILTGESGGDIHADNPKSDAYGAFQAMPGTRRTVLKKTGKDFWGNSLAEQTAAAHEWYKMIPGVTEALQRGDIAKAVDILNDKQWTSLPGGPEQSKYWNGRKLDEIIDSGGARVASSGAIAPTSPTVAAAPTKPAPTKPAAKKPARKLTKAEIAAAEQAELARQFAKQPGGFAGISVPSGGQFIDMLSDQDENPLGLAPVFTSKEKTPKDYFTAQNILADYRTSFKGDSGGGFDSIKKVDFGTDFLAHSGFNMGGGDVDDFLGNVQDTLRALDKQQKQVFQDFVQNQRDSTAVAKQFADAFADAYENAPERFRSLANDVSIVGMSFDQLAESAAAFNDFSFEPLTDEAKQLGETLVDTVGGGFKSVIGDMVKGTKSLGESLLDVIGSVAGSLADLALNSVFGSASSGTGLLGSIFGSVFGGGGASFSGIAPLSTLSSLPFMADGGLTNREGLAYLHKNEMVVPLGKLSDFKSGSGGGSPINITVNNHGFGTPTDKQNDKMIDTVLRVIDNKIDSKLIKHKQRGGLLHG